MKHKYKINEIVQLTGYSYPSIIHIIDVLGIPIQQDRFKKVAHDDLKRLLFLIRFHEKTSIKYEVINTLTDDQINSINTIFNL
jgi:hypothetical protein